MGHEVFSRPSYSSSVSFYTSSGKSATSRGHEEVRRTGKLNPLVDPSEYGVIRRSLPRFEQEPSGLWRLTVGLPVPIEIRLDTTGSMGDNIDRALKVLPETYELSSQVLPGFDVQIAIGIFADCVDDFVLCRPQFEMEAEKIVNQLTLMHPESGGGGNGGEDPQYGLFGAAYLTDSRINKWGLKGYDFTISDEPARDCLSISQLERIFGESVMEKAVENSGFGISKNELPTTEEVVSALLGRAHAFFLEVEGWHRESTHRFWTKTFGEDRVVVLPNVDLLPQVQAVIIGLTEGTLSMDDTTPFLTENGVSKSNAERIVRSVSNIPIGAQATLRAKIKKPLPQKGDLFKRKTNLWPCEAGVEATSTADKDEGPGWL